MGKLNSPIRRYNDLDVYRLAMESAMIIFEITRSFPAEEKFSLTDQIRKSSRSVCSNIAEAWRKRRYRAAFISKLSDAEAEAGETQVWLEFTLKCGYADRKTTGSSYRQYDRILGKLVRMIDNPDPWLLP
jgi:four helix bundle protein